jgi:hypothetical protein
MVCEQNLISQYQTLIAGALALIGAGFLFLGNHQMVSLQRRVEVERAQRRLRNFLKVSASQVQTLFDEAEQILENASDVLERQERNGETMRFIRGLQPLDNFPLVSRDFYVDFDVPESVVESALEITDYLRLCNLDIQQLRSLGPSISVLRSSGVRVDTEGTQQIYDEIFDLLRSLTALLRNLISEAAKLKAIAETELGEEQGNAPQEVLSR